MAAQRVSSTKREASRKAALETADAVVTGRIGIITGTLPRYAVKMRKSSALRRGIVKMSWPLAVTSSIGSKWYGGASLRSKDSCGPRRFGTRLSEASANPAVFRQ